MKIPIEEKMWSGLEPPHIATAKQSNMSGEQLELSFAARRGDPLVTAAPFPAGGATHASDVSLPQQEVVATPPHPTGGTIPGRRNHGCKETKQADSLHEPERQNPHHPRRQSRQSHGAEGQAKNPPSGSRRTAEPAVTSKSGAAGSTTGRTGKARTGSRRTSPNRPATSTEG